MLQCLTKVYDDNVVIVLRESWSNISSHPWLSISSMNGINVSDQIRPRLLTPAVGGR